jgi:hypothetical protein
MEQTYPVRMTDTEDIVERVPRRYTLFGACRVASVGLFEFYAAGDSEFRSSETGRSQQHLKDGYLHQVVYRRNSLELMCAWTDVDVDLLMIYEY